MVDGSHVWGREGVKEAKEEHRRETEMRKKYRCPGRLMGKD